MFCKNCGSQIADGSSFCQNCGTKVNEEIAVANTTNSSDRSDGLGVVAKVFMVLSCIVLGFYIIPLFWTIPMTVSAFKKINKREKISTGFKVCILLFVNTLAGIFLLCRKDEA